MMNRSAWWAGASIAARASIATIAAVVIAGSGCRDPGLLALEVVVPEGPDPFAGVTRLRLAVSSPAAQQVLEVPDGADAFTIEEEISIDGEVGSILLEGLAGDELLARGETPPLILRTTDDRMALLVGRAGELSRLRPRLPSPGREMIAVLVPSLGLLLAGGTADDDEPPLETAAVYDFFAHELREVAPMPAPRAGAVAVSCGGHCALVALGRVSDGQLASDLLRFDGSGWRAFDDGLEAIQRRSDAGVLGLSDGTYLIAGGEGPRGPLASLLVLDPGQGLDPRLSVGPVAARAARTRPALALASAAVLIAGGQQAGEVEAELYLPAAARTEPLELPGAELAGGAAAVALPDGRIVLLGGRDQQGVVLDDAWVVDPVALQVEHRPGALHTARAGHQALLVDQRLVIVGGVGEGDVAAEDAEVLAADGGLARLDRTPMQHPRQGHAVGRLGRGSFVVVGGSAPGQPATDAIELYQSGARSLDRYSR